MQVHQTDSPGGPCGRRTGDVGGDRDATFPLERELDGREVQERERGEDGVPAILRIGRAATIPHRRHVVQIQCGAACHLVDAEPAAWAPRGTDALCRVRSRRQRRWNGVAAAVHLLEQQCEVLDRGSTRQAAAP